MVGRAWINYQRPSRATEDNGRVSLYHGDCSPRDGTVAFTSIPEVVEVVRTDIEPFARCIVATVAKGKPFGTQLPFVEALFSRGGDIATAPTWTIAIEGRTIVVTWTRLQTPYVGPPAINPDSVFIVLWFADGGSITVDDQRADGAPYARDWWMQKLRAPHSSCCFVPTETMIAGNGDSR